MLRSVLHFRIARVTAEQSTEKKIQVQNKEDNMVRVIMHGCNGRMGQVITEMIAKEAEMEIVAGGGLERSYPKFLSRF